MKEEKEKLFLMLDLETTGLDPMRDAILEIACFPIDVERVSTIPENRKAFGSVMPFGDPGPGVDSFVREMHQKSGLWAECREALENHVIRQQVYERLYDYLLETGAEERSVVFVGNSIHFDRSFLQAQAPGKLTRLFHHRVVDVSSLLMCAETWTGKPRPEKKEAHRAMDDCLESLELLRWCRAALVG